MALVCITLSNVLVALLFTESLVLFDRLGPVLLVDLHLVDRVVHAREDARDGLEVGADHEVDEADLAAAHVCGLAVTEHRDVETQLSLFVALLNVNKS